MKILQLGKFYPLRGGVEKVMYSLTTGLSQRGIECDMMCAAEKGRSTVTRINDKASLITCRTLFKCAATMISPAMIFRLRKIARNYDIIHLHHPDPMAALALRLSGFTGDVVLHWHSDILKQKKLLKLYRPLQSWIILRCSEIIGTSPVYLEESPELKGTWYKQNALPIGIEEMNADPAGAAAIRSRFPGKKIVFSLGRLIEYKGFRYLVDAARTLDDSYVIVIGGEGPLKESLRKQIADAGLQDKVILEGFIPDDRLPAYFGACDLFCLSSVFKTEAFGIVQIEAMSCGKPVVTTKIPGSGVSWVNEDGVSGINVPPADPEALAAAIRDICSDPDRYKAYCDAARKRYETMFTKDKMIEDCIRIYKSIL